MPIGDLHGELSHLVQLLPDVAVKKIVSGGQTGADRGGLEAAAELGIARGGWAPRGWLSEDGMIPPWYREGMVESHAGSYRVRTDQNVQDSDGTVIVSFGDLTFDSGSYLTSKMCRKRGRRYRHYRIFGNLWNPAVRWCREWIEETGIVTLNVAGPRESREPGIQLATRRFMIEVLASGTGPV